MMYICAMNQPRKNPEANPSAVNIELDSSRLSSALP